MPNIQSGDPVPAACPHVVYNGIVLDRAYVAALRSDTDVAESSRQRLSDLADQKQVFVILIEVRQPDAPLLPGVDRVIHAVTSPNAETVVQGIIRDHGLHPWKLLFFAQDHDGVPTQPQPFGAPPGPADSRAPPRLDDIPTMSDLPLPDTAPRNAIAILNQTLDTRLFAPRLNISDTATSIAAQPPSILRDFVRVADQAKTNRQQAMDFLANAIPTMANVGRPFDDRSGAVAFSPSEWHTLVASAAETTDAIQRHLVPYFDERWPNTWDRDRPNKRRLLYTSSRILLRGEQYFWNMRKNSPLLRIKRIWDDCLHLFHKSDDLLEHDFDASAITPGDASWRIALAFLDHVRHYALQTFLFVHAVPFVIDSPLDPFPEQDVNDTAKGAAKKTALTVLGDDAQGVHGFLYHAIRTYYSWLLGKCSRSWQHFLQAKACFLATHYKLADRLLPSVERYLIHERNRGRWFPIDELVRGWREADHPGQNLLTTALAAKALANDAETFSAVGIGWGGIELPLVFDYICEQINPDMHCDTHIARWSHYRSPDRAPHWSHFPKHEAEFPSLNNRTLVVFDDNTLTGITLERIRDELLMRGAESVHMFVTRYSGERRHAHMTMTGHGSMDPLMLLGEVGGFTGETPFARSWSTMKYVNSLGIFSLARRRVLECLHNNGVVQLYDREGF